MLAAALCMSTALLAASGVAAQTYLLTDYPEFTAQVGDTKTLPLTLHNDAKQPVRLSLDVQGLPVGWKASLLGGGQPVRAALAPPETSVPLQLRLEIPADASAPQEHALTLMGRGDGESIVLPLRVMLAENVPPSLGLETRLPALRGAPGASFDFQFTVRNDSGKDMLIQLDGQGPESFELTFSESYGSQQITSVPIKAGESKDLKLSVRTPQQAKADTYPVRLRVAGDNVQATADVQVELVGQPRLRLVGRDGRMSGEAQVGRTESLPILLRNEGSAPAANIQLSGSGPSGWDVSFEPKEVAALAPGEEVQVQARIQPSERSLVGDYMVTLLATGQGDSASGDFRITVKSSNLWGIWGVVVIAIAVLILVGAVARFGRR